MISVLGGMHEYKGIFLFLALMFYSLCNVPISGLFSGNMSGHGYPNVEYFMVYSHIISRVAGKILYPS